MPEKRGELIDWRSPQTRREQTSWIGMVVFLGSWAMMFASFFFAYGGLRSKASVWPPPGMPPLPVGLSGANTAVILLSSVALQGALMAVRRNRVRLCGPLLLSSVALGGVFVGLQLYTWELLHDQGMRAATGPYASVFYGLTWLHAAHVAVGLVALAFLTFRAFRGRYSAPRHTGVRLWTMYWHFVGIVWIVIYVSVYLL